MNGLGIIFLIVTVGVLFALPRRWVTLPLLLGTTYMTTGQVVEIGPFHFTVIRFLVAAGILRVIINRERIVGGLHRLDWMMILWGIWAICSSMFHKDPASMFVSMLGMTYTNLGLYFLMRIFIQDSKDFLVTAKIILLLLLPVAVEMVMEKLTDRNAFAVFGYVTEMATIRHGKIRAQGPFGHSILAGTVGAVCMPLIVLFYRHERKLAVLGLVVTGTMVLASTSSGPILTAFSAFMALALWRFRAQLRLIRWAIILAIVALDLVMNDPVYYLLARVDLTGSSTGWYRAQLIRSAIEHFNEWWLAGTDYTRNWLPTGVPWNQNQTDITNHYIAMGVWGGLPLMLLFMGVLWAAFAAIGKSLRLSANEPFEQQFLFWTLGSILFAHALTFLSVSYFDQSIVFLYLLLASIGSLSSSASVLTSSQIPVCESSECDPKLSQCC
jgi:hypothetical protein